MTPPRSPSGPVGDRAVLRLNARLKSDRVAARIERAIIAGELAPGELLAPENVLAEAFGVSMTVMRDAMRALSTRGLVSVRQGRGTIVEVPNEAEFERALVTLLARSGHSTGDVFDARGAIETALVGIVAPLITSASLERLDGLLHALGAAVTERDEARAQEAHSGFHRTILDSIDLPALQTFVRPLHGVIVATGGSPTADLDELRTDLHVPILDALRARDSVAAMAAMDAHFAYYRDRYPAYRARPFRAVYLDTEPDDPEYAVVIPRSMPEARDA